MLGRRIDALMPKCLLRLMNITLGKLHMHVGQNGELTRRGSSNRVGSVKAVADARTHLTVAVDGAYVGTASFRLNRGVGPKNAILSTSSSVTSCV